MTHFTRSERKRMTSGKGTAHGVMSRHVHARCTPVMATMRQRPLGFRSFSSSRILRAAPKPSRTWEATDAQRQYEVRSLNHRVDAKTASAAGQDAAEAA